MSRPRFAICLAVAALGCSDLAEPKHRPGMEFLQPAVPRDTVTAILPVAVRVTGDDGRPLANAWVEFRGRAGLALGHGVQDSAGGSSVIPGLPELHTQADARGIASVYVRLGGTTGEALLHVTASVRHPADGTLLAQFVDSLRFEVLPGAIAGIVAVPADTAIGVSQSYDITAYAADRYRNRRPEVVALTTSQSLDPAVAVSQAGSVTSVAIGRAAIELATPHGHATAFVSVVPPATIAAVQNDEATAVLYQSGGDLVLFEQNAGPMLSLLQGTTAGCPRWHPAGDRVLLSGLRIVTIAGVVTQLPIGNAALVAGCGEFTADGEWIFFAAWHPSQAAWLTQIWRIRTDGSGLQQITFDDGSGYRHMVSPSPDGQRLAYAWTHQEQTRVVLHTLDTGHVDSISPRIPNGPGTRVTSVQWSPTGEWLAYTHRDPALHYFHDKWTAVYGSRVTLVRPDDPAVRYTLPAASAPTREAFLGGVTWSPDGEWLIGNALDRDSRLMLMHVATGAVLPLHGSTRTLHSAAWRPAP